jgi:hypothetical protein
MKLGVTSQRLKVASLGASRANPRLSGALTYLKGAGGSWGAEINGYQFGTSPASVLRRVLEGTPRQAGNRLPTFETPGALADRMRDLAAIILSDHVLEPSAGRGRLIAKLPQKQQITAIEIEPSRAAHLAMMPHCRVGTRSVSQTNFLDRASAGTRISHLPSRMRDSRLWIVAVIAAVVPIAGPPVALRVNHIATSQPTPRRRVWMPQTAGVEAWIDVAD